MADAYVGTSGFAYPAWKGSFYPVPLPSARFLEHYASRLPAVEINYTFRRDATPSMVEGWAAATPEEFRFAVKASMRVTHFWPLEPPDDVLAGFLSSVAPLGPRLGPILFQTPPRFQLDRDRLARFLDRLPDRTRAAFEFRHPSWEDARDLVESAGAAWCVSETESADAPDFGAGTFAYARLRRGGYDDAALERWAARVRTVLEEGRDAYVFFKHEGGDEGPAWARALIQRLGQPGGASRSTIAARTASARTGSSTRRPSRSRT